MRGTEPQNPQNHRVYEKVMFDASPKKDCEKCIYVFLDPPFGCQISAPRSVFGGKGAWPLGGFRFIFMYTQPAETNGDKNLHHQQ